MIRPRRLAIVGGGIAGLSLAVGLDPRRWVVTLHEAQPERAPLGAPLGLWPPALEALDRLGVDAGTVRPSDTVGARVRAAAVPARSGALFTEQGRRLFGITAPEALRLVGRGDLIAALTAALPPTVRLVPGEVSDPRTLDADVVVGADGVRSRVRGLVAPGAAERVATDQVALRGLVPTPPDPAQIGEYWGPGRVFGIAPAPGGTYWFAAYRLGASATELSEPLDPLAEVRRARELYADAAPGVRALLAQADGRTLATRLWQAPPLRRYARGRYVVIGDAAHAMLPNLGRGAGEAIVDAATLAEALNAGVDLGRWQARRVPATQAVRLGSAAMSSLATTRTLAAARNRLLAGIGRVGVLPPLSSNGEALR